MEPAHSNAVTTEPEAQPAIDWALVQAVLRRVEDALVSFLDTGESGAIDLRGVPHMAAATYQALSETLATGEVSATVAAYIRVEIRETQYPGVWWITHFNERGATVTEVIEITEVPAILRSHFTDMRSGLERLRQARAAPALS